MESRKVIGVISAIYAVLMAISVVVGFLRPNSQTNIIMKQIGGFIGIVVSGAVAWYMLKDEKVVPLQEQR